MTDEELAEVEMVESATTEEAETLGEETPGEGQQAEAAESAESEEKDSEKSDKVSPKTQQRINELTAEKYRLREEKEKLAEQLKQFQQQQASDLKEPTLDDPDINHDPVKYKEKLTEYLQATASAPSQAPAVDTTRNEKVEAFGEKVEAFKEQAPDYVDVVGKMPIDVETSDLLLEMENGPAIAYHLGGHLDQLDRIMQLPPLQRALEISKLNERFTPAEPLTTQAPDPVPSVTQGGSTINKDPGDMTMEELALHDEKQWEAAHR